MANNVDTICTSHDQDLSQMMDAFRGLGTGHADDHIRAFYRPSVLIRLVAIRQHDSGLIRMVSLDDLGSFPGICTNTNPDTIRRIAYLRAIRWELGFYPLMRVITLNLIRGCTGTQLQ